MTRALPVSSVGARAQGCGAKFSTPGEISSTTAKPRRWAKEAAEAGGAIFIDLNGLVADKYDALGQEVVKPFFPNEHTHIGEAGARLNAETVVAGLKALPGNPFGAFLKETAK